MPDNNDNGDNGIVCEVPNVNVTERSPGVSGQVALAHLGLVNPSHSGLVANLALGLRLGANLTLGLGLGANLALGLGLGRDSLGLRLQLGLG